MSKLWYVLAVMAVAANVVMVLLDQSRWWNAGAAGFLFAILLHSALDDLSGLGTRPRIRHRKTPPNR